MAKKFYFDDEFEQDEIEYDMPTHKMTEKASKTKQHTENKPKGKKKMPKKLYIFLGVCAAIAVFVIVYCVVVSFQKGPIYGKRCTGLVTQITETDTSSAVSKATSTYDEIESIDYEIACKQVKIDIVFKKGTSAQDAESIGEHAAMILDDVVGLDKDDNQSYSKLFGVVDGENQYEINLYMICEDNEDFPIYGTKTAISDTFGYTLASVKDQASKQKALDTKEE